MIVRLRRRDGIKQRYHVKGYNRKGHKGKKVSGYDRKPRKLGKKIRFKKTGICYTAIDEKGNLRGSKIKKYKSQI